MENEFAAHLDGSGFSGKNQHAWGAQTGQTHIKINQGAVRAGFS
jgi:hypothetical protein